MNWFDGCPKKVKNGLNALKYENGKKKKEKITHTQKKKLEYTRSMNAIMLLGALIK